MKTAVPVATHIVEFRERLAVMTRLVAKHAAARQEKQKQQYDKNASSQSTQAGDQVLVLLPVGANRLKLQWTGPYKVTRKVGEVVYKIEMPGRRQEKKIYHVNLMKKLHVTPSQSLVQMASLMTDPKRAAVEDNSTEAEYLEEVNCSGPSDEQFFPLDVSGTQEVKLDIEQPKKGQLEELFLSFPEVLTNTPGRTTLIGTTLHQGQ